MDLDEFAKRHYFWELERRAELNDALSVPLGLVTAIAGIVAFYFDSFLAQIDIIRSSVWLVLTVPTSLVLSIVSVGVSAAYLIRSRVSLRTYRYIPTAQEIIEWHGSLEKYYGEKSKADEAVRRLLRERYSLGATHNCQHNDYRSNLMNRAFYALVLTLFPLALLTGLYLYVKTIEVAQDASRSAGVFV